MAEAAMDAVVTGRSDDVAVAFPSGLADIGRDRAASLQPVRVDTGAAAGCGEGVHVGSAIARLDDGEEGCASAGGVGGFSDCRAKEHRISDAYAGRCGHGGEAGGGPAAECYQSDIGLAADTAPEPRDDDGYEHGAGDEYAAHRRRRCAREPGVLAVCRARN